MADTWRRIKGERDKEENKRWKRHDEE